MAAGKVSKRPIDNGGWPTFAVLAKVGTHAACVVIVHIYLTRLIVWTQSQLTRAGKEKLWPPGLVAPTFTKNVKVGQPPTV
jgi:hypothetical protein